jgi:hypothetical protein
MKIKPSITYFSKTLNDLSSHLKTQHEKNTLMTVGFYGESFKLPVSKGV